MKQLQSLIIVLLLTLAVAFSASATETNRTNKSGEKHQHGTQSVTHSGNHGSSHHRGTLHNNSQKTQ